MSPWSRRLNLALVTLVVLVFAPLPAALAASALAPSAGAPALASAHAAPALPEATSLSPAQSAGSSHLLNAAHAAMAKDHIPTKDVLLPNFHPAISTTGNVVTPLYPTSPAPMGLGFFGVEKQGSRNVGTVGYTSSVEASVTLNSVNPFYLASTSPDIFTMQLNTVATHVDVLGNTSGEYWIQNVPIYTASTQTLGFEDNIWNFSSPGAGMLDGTLYNYSGNLVAPTFYYAEGPTYSMPTPFTVNLYNNLTISDHRPTVWFNYTIYPSTGAPISGSFDKVEFNSTANPNPTRNAPMPTFQIDGKQTNPIGLINDAEIMLGGPGGGSTTTLNGINATMGLWLKSNSSGHYAAIPAAFDFGTDTGETSEGIAEYAGTSAHAPVAVLGSGPSILAPLWGLAGASPGFVQATFHVAPSNAFAFGNLGKRFSTDTAAWGPIPASGTAVWRLPAGHDYTFQFLLADHTPRTVTILGSTSTTITLAANRNLGVYTPLWAWDNGQLAAISSGGSGTLGNPYVLDNNGPAAVSPLFGEFNDYYFPVFPGLLLADTTAYVTATHLTDFPIAYTITPEARATSFYGTPIDNNLALEAYNATHIQLWDNPSISGWAFYQTFYESSLLFWDVSDSLLGANTFQVMGEGAQIFGGTNNVVWGNVFTPVTAVAADPATVAEAGAQVGLEVYETGDSIWNNAFETPYTAFTPGFNLYTGAPALWTDRWNITPQSAALVHHVNGVNLSGSILGLGSVSGNFWQDYGTPGNPYGQLPYDEYGAISVGGDSHPLLTYAIHKITFDAANLTLGDPWSVTINGYTQTSTSSSILFWEPAGTYAFTVTGGTGYAPHPAQGAITLSTHGVKRTITFY